jgi:glutamate racemase
MKKEKIGVFDSGFGGLTILKEIVRVLPQYDYVYLGDSARAPYGDRSQNEIYEFTRQGVNFLFNKGAAIVILACNSASSEALRKIQHEMLKGKFKDKKVLGVIVPAVEAATEKSIRSIAVIGTEATVASGAFKREILKIDPSIEVYEIATPLLAPLVEEGMQESYGTEILVAEYMKEVMSHDVDALILGCTHYRILEKAIMKHAKGVHIVSEGETVALKLKEYLRRHKEIECRLAQDSGREFFTTDKGEKFSRFGSLFFGQKIISKKTDLK